LKFDMLDIKNLVTTFDPGEPTGDAFLDARWDGHVAKFGHGRPYWRLFWKLCNLYRPGLAVELGAWQATCAAHMAGGGAATVATIDHHTDPGDKENRRLSLEAAQKYLNLFYFQGWTWDVVHEVRDLGKPVDVLFIDSWHHYDKAMRDWDAYSPLLADEALVVCDDVCDVEPTLHRMTEFWEDVSRGRERFLVEGLSACAMGFFKWEAV